MTEYAYIDGDIEPIEKATISVRDRGFIFGDGVYDVAKIKHGKIFQLSRHVKRLRKSAEALNFQNIPSSQRLSSISKNVHEASSLSDGMLYLQLTRGAVRRQSAWPDEIEPTVFISAEQTDRGADAYRKDGAKAVFVEDIRWKRNNIKTTNLLPKVLKGTKAKKSGAYEGLYRDQNGYVWEGTSTNYYIVRDEKIVTPPKSSKLLPGITRQNVQELSNELNIPFIERQLTDTELIGADEIFISGTLTEILGITELENQTIGNGEVGPVTQKLYRAYLDLYPGGT